MIRPGSFIERSGRPTHLRLLMQVRHALGQTNSSLVWLSLAAWMIHRLPRGPFPHSPSNNARTISQGSGVERIRLAS